MMNNVMRYLVSVRIFFSVVQKSKDEVPGGAMVGSLLAHQHSRDLSIYVLAIYFIIIRSLITTPFMTFYFLQWIIYALPAQK